MITSSLQRATNTMMLPDAAAAMGDLPPPTEPLTEPPDEGAPPNFDAPGDVELPPHTQSDPEVHFLTDARNGFGELSRMAMLWEVRHRWPA